MSSRGMPPPPPPPPPPAAAGRAGMRGPLPQVSQQRLPVTINSQPRKASKWGEPPKGYIPGLGRGASGFTTRSDIGNMSSSSVALGGAATTDDGDDHGGGTGTSGSGGGSGGGGGLDNNSVVNVSGSRASEQRAAKLAAQKLQQQQQQQQQMMMMMNDSNGNIGPLSSSTSSTSFPVHMMTMEESAAAADAAEDDEADQIWQAIEDRMNSKRMQTKKKRKRDGTASSGATDGSNSTSTSTTDPNDANATARARIGAQFRELKQELATVSEEDWLKIPEVGDYSLKFKKSRQQQQNAQHSASGHDTFTPLTDSLLESRSKLLNQQEYATTVQSSSTNGTETTTTTTTTTMALSGLGAARGTVLGMSLDKMSDSVTGQTVVDPQGYLTSMASSSVNGGTDGIMAPTNVGDIEKARLLLKSVRDTNPKHGPGWIASARVEEAAGKLLKARKIIQEGCQVCGDTEEDVWLEAARLHPVPVAKSILATAVRRIPTSVKLFLKAADYEVHDSAKKAVLRKALQANPTSLTLWKAAIDLEEDTEDAKVLLSVAVEKVPYAVDLWLALARLETYDNARKVLNQARRALPAERSIWIAAAKLEEGQQHHDLVHKLMARAFATLHNKSTTTSTTDQGEVDDSVGGGVVVTRDQWLQEAEQAEAAGAPLTSAAIVKNAIGMDVEEEDRQRTWSEDAKGAIARGSIATARAILSHALQAFPTKRSLWMQAVELERLHGTSHSLDEVLQAASERLPRVELFWLLRAKERWMAGDLNVAREILTQAFAANPDSESVWLAAAKLEWETGEAERARVLLQRARERAPTERVYMKSALLERQTANYRAALDLIQQGLDLYPKFPKLYMMAGQIYAWESLPPQATVEQKKSHLTKARKMYQRGLTECPNNVVLWILASRLEEEEGHKYTTTSTTTTDPADASSTMETNGYHPKEVGSSSSPSSASSGVTKARSLLELARLKNPKTPALWLEAVRLERRAGNLPLAETLLARALQECPTSGELLAESIVTAPRVEQKSKSTVAIQRCPESPLVIGAVASLFANERKVDKARKWLERAVVLNPDGGDAWARYYAFETIFGTPELAAAVKERCLKAEPKHGEVWQSIVKDMKHRHKPLEEGLELVSQALLQQPPQQDWKRFKLQPPSQASSKAAAPPQQQQPQVKQEPTPLSSKNGNVDAQ